MKLKVIFAAVAIVCAVGCGSSVRDVLDVAERQMQERPDSSLALLERVDAKRIMLHSDRARYSLLYAQARDKNFIDDVSDSVIRPAVDYYSRRHDYERRFMSLYYLGRVYENAGDFTKAILSYTQAEELCDKVDNDFAKGLLYAHLGAMYNKCYDLPKSLEALQEAEYAEF